MNNTYGLSFPIILDNGSPAKPGLLDSIESSIRVILAWALNQRNFNSQFGSALEALVGSPNSEASKKVVQIFVVKAVARWEKRITITSSDIKQDKEFLAISINATINETQTAFTTKILV